MTKGCPLCKKRVHSDVHTGWSCQLCGMPLEKTKTVILRTDGETFRFCSQRCKLQFVAVKSEAIA